MTQQTLADLQALADAEDKVAAGVIEDAEADEEAPENEEEQEETLEEGEQSDEDEPDEDGAESEPDWAKKPDAKNFVPARVHSELRKNLRATQSDADAVKVENEQLKARLAALESGHAEASPQVLKMPTLAECDFDDAIHAQKLAEYSAKLVEQKLSERERSQAATSQALQLSEQINSQVDKHYERASVLIGRGTVTAENYQAADMIVRKAIAESVKSDPDYVADYMIANLGDGSEKVMYHLGVNPEALGKLKEAFRSDPSGIRAAAFLGELKGKFNSAPATKLSNAPKPDKALSGNAKVTTESSKKAYEKAQKAGDVSGMIAAEKAGKAKGINTSNW